MKPRFAADTDLNRAIVSGVKRRELTIDFLSAHALSLEGLDDSQVLSIAADERCILVSHDFGTMPGHFRDFTASHPSPGLFLVLTYLPL